jgi:hypothetical protein
VLIFGQGRWRPSCAPKSPAAGSTRRALRRLPPRSAALAGGLDLLVHPADMEGLGVSLLQASAAAVPIVTTAPAGCPRRCWMASPAC